MIPGDLHTALLIAAVAFLLSGIGIAGTGKTKRNPSTILLGLILAVLGALALFALTAGQTRP
jgi:hypothetical protein